MLFIESLEARQFLSADGFIKAAGTVLRDGHGAGDVVLLQGTNVGGWLLKEGWMTPMDSSGASPDDYTARQTLITRFGAATADSLIDSYENSWITLNDLDNIKAMGMNVIRLPFWYRNLQDEDGTWRADRFERMDWLVSNAWARGIYTILDFHGVVGGQSTADHTGRARATAEFWSNPTYQQRTIDIWTAIAAHFKNNPGVAAYDLINEPGGTPSSTTLWNMYDQMYDAIRAVDPDHLITMEGSYGSWNWSMLPDPATYGWTNVMYQMHEYQFGSTSDPAAIKAGTDNQVADFNAHKSWNVPAYVGEFNDFSPASDPSGPWIYAVQQYQNAGINWSEWSYKSSNGSGTNSWGIYNRLSPTPVVPNLQTDSAAAIQTDWNAWTTSNAARVNTLLLPPLTIHLGALPTGFTDADINTPGVAGAASFDSSRGTWTLWGGGADIVNAADQFNFASKSFTGDGTITAKVSNQSNTDPWSKVGVMLRDTTAAGAMYAAVMATPGNGVTFQWRNATNANSAETHITGLKAPIWVRLTRSVNNFTAYYSTNGTTWTQIGTTQTIAMPASLRAGLAACAHNNTMLTTATFTNFSTVPSGWTAQDIGASTAPPGYASNDSTNNWTIAGGGTGIGGTNDQFNFTWRTFGGNSILSANVAAITAGNPNAKAGLMYRPLNSDNAQFAYVFVTPANQVGFEWRSTTGAASTLLTVNAALPRWIKLIRTNSNFGAYYSSDGINWTQIGTPQTVNMPFTAMVGMAATSADSTKVIQATFQNLNVTQKLSMSLFGTAGNDNYYARRDGVKLNVWRNLDGSGTPAQSMDYDDLGSFSLDGAGGDDTFLLDFSGGMPLLTPLAPGSNSLAGLAGNDLVKILSPPSDQPILLSQGQFSVGTALVTLNGFELIELGPGQISQLGLSSSARVAIAASGATLTTGSLTVDSNSQLDLRDNDLVVGSGDLATVTGLVARGRNTGIGGRWTGSGITSSTAAANIAHGLAVLSEGSAVRVKFTWLGDFNGDGTVNADDYAALDAGFATHATGYANGDVDYSGSINSDDYFYTDFGFSAQNPPSAPPQAPLSGTAGPTKARKHHHRLRPIPPSSLPLAASRFHP